MPELVNPWDEGGQQASDWSADNAEVLDTVAVEWGNGAQGNASPMSLHPPQTYPQETRTTCWSAAFLSWLEVTIPSQAGTKFQFPSDLIIYLRPKKCSNGAPVLFANDSLRHDGLNLWNEVIADIIHTCGSNQTINSKRVLATDFTVKLITDWIREGKYVLVGEVRSEEWKHVYVVYGVDSTKAVPIMFTMDPDGGVLIEKSIPPSSDAETIYFCTTKT